MTVRKPISDLTKTWSKSRLAAVKAEKRALEVEAVTLEQLRQALGLSQEEMADLLDVQQPAISKLERRDDMKISTLRELIEAMGGRLEITATFADRAVELANLGVRRR